MDGFSSWAIFSWVAQLALDCVLVAIVSWLVVQVHETRSSLSKARKELARGGVRAGDGGTGAPIGGLDELLDDLERLIRESSRTAAEIEATVRSNTEQIDRRLGLLDLKREDLEGILDRADEVLARHERERARAPRAPAEPVLGRPDARDRRGLDLHQLEARLRLARGDASEEVAEATGLSLADLEVLNGLVRRAPPSPGLGG